MFYTNRIQPPMNQLISNCCGAKALPGQESDVCGRCFEHCDFQTAEEYAEETGLVIPLLLEILSEEAA